MLKRCLLLAALVAAAPAFGQFQPKIGAPKKSSEPSESSKSGEAPASEGLRTYAGFDYITGNFSNSVGTSSSTSTTRFKSDFNMLRARRPAILRCSLG